MGQAEGRSPELLLGLSDEARVPAFAPPSTAFLRPIADSCTGTEAARI